MTIEKIGPRAQRFEYLDLLRLLCAVAVVLFHFDVIGPTIGPGGKSASWAPAIMVYGQFGVQFFFMISGFVIALSLAGRSTASFAWSRALRLYPAFCICAAFTAGFALLLAVPDDTLWKPDFGGFLANLTMLPGYLGFPYIDEVYWTLTLELRFYVMVALVSAIGLRVDSLGVMGGWIAGLVAGLFVPVIGTVLMQIAAPYFIIGVLALMLRRPERRAAKLALMAVAIALCWPLLIAQDARWAPHGLTPWSPGVAFVIVAIAAATVTACGFAPSPRRFSGVLRSAGAVTYPLYVLHNTIGLSLLYRFSAVTNGAIAAVAAISCVALLTLLVTFKLEPELRRAMAHAGSRAIARFSEKRASRPDRTGMR